jgi:aminoglycoside phosphotransferase (APT) family kinase protein
MTGDDGRRAAVVDREALAAFFARHVPGFAGSLDAEPILGGRSNLIYDITDGTQHWILRRPPLGLVAPSANDIGREYRVVKALGPTSVPVARAIAYCDDPAVIGAPFSVVSKVEGRVIRSAADGAALDPADARAIADALIRGLVAVHGVAYQEVGLGDLGRPTGYLARQVSRWKSQWDLVATRDLPQVERLQRGLVAATPTESDATIVHGDYRLDNTILDPLDPTTLAAIVDWEMATIGDPLADVGLLLVYWDPACASVMPEGHSIAANRGFPAVGEVAETYATLSGRDLDHLAFYRALGYFKLAVIAEGIHNRYRDGLTIGHGFETVGAAVAPLIDAGLEILHA